MWKEGRQNRRSQEERQKRILRYCIRYCTTIKTHHWMARGTPKLPRNYTAQTLNKWTRASYTTCRNQLINCIYNHCTTCMKQIINSICLTARHAVKSSQDSIIYWIRGSTTIPTRGYQIKYCITIFKFNGQTTKKSYSQIHHQINWEDLVILISKSHSKV